MFLLYKKKHKTYPEEIIINGDSYQIDADFRNILRIFDMLGDENICEIKQIEMLGKWFFKDGVSENMAFDDISKAFIDFINRSAGTQERTTESAAPSDETERQFCYNFDAEEIYASFLSEYKIDLIDADFMHWYKFKILLGNLSPESAFKRKVELRFMDLSNLYAGNGRNFSELAQAKESVRLPVRNFRTDGNLQSTEEFNNIWGKAGGS